MALWWAINSKNNINHRTDTMAGLAVPSTVEYLALLLVSISDTQPCSSAVANR